MPNIEIHFDKRINNATIIREPDVRQRREYVLVTLIASFFVLSLLFYGWQHYRYIQYGYRIEEMKTQKQMLVEAREHLRLERAALRDRQRIDAKARRELGMVAPVAGQWVTLTGDAPLTIPTPADSTQPALSAKFAGQQ